MGDLEDEQSNKKNDRFGLMAKKPAYGVSAMKKPGYNVVDNSNMKKLKENSQDSKDSKLSSMRI